MKAYRSDLSQFLQWRESSVAPDEFDLLACQWLNDTRRDTAPKTTCRRLTSLRIWGKWAGWETSHLSEYAAPVPAKAVPHPLPEGPAGVVRLIEQTRDHETRALLALCGLAGLRVNEALSLPPTSADVSHRSVTIRGKGDRSRTVPLSDTCWNLVLPALADARVEGRAFVITLPDRTARDRITRLGQKAGLTRAISSHDLRATFATAAYRRSKDIRAVQELLGHATCKTTEVYIEVKMEEMRDAGDILEP